ncbi:MAG: hypothetical protein ACXWUG_27825, partial [Polyangiales bacterium]
MRALRFVAFGLAIGLVHCGGSDSSFTDDNTGDTGDESSTGDGGDEATTDSELPDTTTSDGDLDTDVDTGTSGDGATDSGTASDSAAGDSAVADSGTPTDSGMLTDSGAGDTMVTDAGCPTLTLGGATEDVYVDKGVAVSGNGTKACPFKTIAAATALAAPGGTTTLRTIHVKGYPAAPDYVETGALVLEAKETLTSNYDT